MQNLLSSEPVFAVNTPKIQRHCAFKEKANVPSTALHILRYRALEDRVQRPRTLLARQNGELTSAPRRTCPLRSLSTESSFSRPKSTNCRLTGALTSDLVIGLSDASLPLNKLPGLTKKTPFSIGCKQTGHIYVNKTVAESGQAVREGDVIGCGVNYLERRVFFTFGQTICHGALTRHQKRHFAPDPPLSDGRH